MVTRNLDVIVRADSKGFNSSMRAAVSSLVGFSDGVKKAETGSATSFKNIDKAARGVSAGLLAAGAAAGLMAVDFDRSMTRIETLVGIASDEVQGMKSSVLELAGETARAPGELADALFVATSAGLRGAAAMDTLELAAKASAIGMGDTASIARLTAGILDQYASKGVDAAEANDVLVATARAGNFEVSQLANSLSRVVPNAAALGVSISDVGGAVALFTRAGANAAQAVTNLDSFLRAFIRPSADAKKALGEVGLSFEELLGTLQNEGLVATIKVLDQAFEGNIQQIGRVITDTQGLTGANLLLNASEQALAATFGEVENSAGILSSAFDQLSQSDSFKFDQAVNTLNVRLTEFGTRVMPTVVSIISGAVAVFGGLFDILALMPDSVLAVSGAVLALQVAGLPLASTFARAGQALFNFATFFPATTTAVNSAGLAVTTSTKRFDALKGAITPASAATLGLTAVVVAGTLAYKKYAERQEQARERASALTAALKEQEGSLPSLTDGLQSTIDRYRDLVGADPTSAVGNVNGEVAAFFELLDDIGDSGGSDLFDKINTSARQLLPVLQTGTDEFGILQSRVKDIATFTGEGAAGFEELRAAVVRLESPNEQLLLGLVNQTEAAGGSLDALEDLLDVFDEQADAYDDVTETQEGYVLGLVRVAREEGVLNDAQADGFVQRVKSAENYAILTSVVQELDAALLGAVDAEESAAYITDFNNAIVAATAFNYTNAAGAVEVFAAATEDSIPNILEEAERLAEVSSELAKQELSYSAVTSALNPYRQALIANQDPAVGLAAANDQATLAIARLSEQITKEDGLGPALRGSASDAAEARGKLAGLGATLQDTVFDLIAAGQAGDDLALSQAELRDEFVRVARQFGATRDEAEILAQQYFDIPPDITTQAVFDSIVARGDLIELNRLAEEYGTRNPTAIAAIRTFEAEAEFARLIAQFDAVGDETFTARLTADATSADLTVASSLLLLAGFDEKTVDVLLQGDPADLQSAVAAAIEYLDDIDGRVANAEINVNTSNNGNPLSLEPQARRGNATFFANGSENHIAQIARPGDMRVWAEPETGGEAYIPLAAAKRGRSMSILQNVANRFGQTLTPMANGGILGMMDGGTVSFGGTLREVDVNVVVNNTGGGGGSEGGVIVQAGAVQVNVESGAEFDDSHVAAITKALEQLCGSIRRSSSRSTGVPGGRIR